MPNNSKCRPLCYYKSCIKRYVSRKIETINNIFRQKYHEKKLKRLISLSLQSTPLYYKVFVVSKSYSLVDHLLYSEILSTNAFNQNYIFNKKCGPTMVDDLIFFPSLLLSPKVRMSFPLFFCLKNE